MLNKKNKITITLQNQIVPAFFVILLGILITFCFDYYYDLNDDTMMKDIVAGIYTGTPEGHNIQMLYPISWLISMCYRISRPISWYGIFFIVCHFGCLYLIANRTAQYFQSIWSKCIVITVEMVTVGAFFLYELVFAQYTVTAALLGATATFLLYTTRQDLSWREFVKHNVGSIILIVIAYQIRTEMLLLLSPLIGVAGISKWAKEKQIFCKNSFKKYGMIIGIILLGILLSEGVNRVAYGSEDWKSFQALFDSRTELYDFQVIPEYEEHTEFYETIGLQHSEQELLENYNFGFDEEINEHTMAEVASYAKENKQKQQPFAVQLKESIKSYIKVVFVEQKELPWNQFIIAVYILIFLIALAGREYSFFWKLPFLVCTRSVLWLYIIYRQRIPNRITHPLYIMELLILCAMMLELGKGMQQKERMKRMPQAITYLPIAVIGIFSVIYLSSGIRYVQTEYNRREAVNKEYLQMQSYCAAHADKIYLLDIYSTVKYSEKMFTGNTNVLGNFEYLGGWASKSPIDRKKLKELGISSIEDAACNQNNVYVISRVDRDIEWLNEYLKEKGYAKEAEKVDDVLNEGSTAFDVYQIIDTNR